jgi:polar amino acid transport system substrate-binding protein
MGWLLRCCWLSCLLSMPAAATELRLVTGDNYPPFVGKDLPGGGLLTQIVRAALAQQQLEHSLDWRPWSAVT